MSLRLVKLEQYTGTKATIYSLYDQNEGKTLFERFIEENEAEYLDELEDIHVRLDNIGHRFGAREQFFKEYEGKGGDMVCALFDLPEKKLRLYCIRLGKVVLILGGGGKKKVRTLQEDEKLKSENYLLREVSAELYKRILDKDIKWSVDGTELLGPATSSEAPPCRKRARTPTVWWRPPSGGSSAGMCPGNKSPR